MLILIKIEIVGKLQMIRFYIKIFNIMDLIFYIINILLLIYYGFKNKINNINNEQIFLFMFFILLIVMFIYKTIILILYTLSSNTIESSIEYLNITLIINFVIFLFALSLYYYDTINKNIIQYIFFILMIKNCILVYLYKTIRMVYDI